MRRCARPVALLLSGLLLLLCLYGCAQPVAETAPPVTSSVAPECPVPSPTPSTPAPTPTPKPTPTPEPDLSTERVKIQLAGDILLHTGPVKSARTNDGYNFTPYFSLIKPFLDGDLSICNMESPVDVYGGNSNLSSYPMFNVPYEILPVLRDTGFNFLLTANNHAYDKKLPGLVATRKNIEKAGVDFTGTFETKEQFEQYKVLDVKGIKVGILNYADADNGMGVTIPADKRPYTMKRFTSASPESLPGMVRDIEDLRSAGAEFVVVALHWGAEYVDKPTATQVQIARGLCSGGADVIMGGHPHCVQPMEWYTAEDGRQCLILYSLGNFFADQLGLNPPKAKTQYGMLVSLNIRLDKKGKLTWDDVDYMPTLCHRVSDKRTPTGYTYRLLPAGAYAHSAERPSLFTRNEDWEKAKSAYQHVTKIVGDAVPVNAGTLLENH